MSRPIIADNKPAKVSLEKGKQYTFCACGRSGNQPFCDGSHADTGIEPISFKAKESGDAFLCRCKNSGNQPYCDGSHKAFDSDQIGDEVPGGTDNNNRAPNPEATREEPYVRLIHTIAEQGLDEFGHHGPMVAMGVSRERLPQWDDLQILAAQLARKPLQENADVATELVVGPESRKPLTLKIPLIVSDMSFGALSEEAKIALSRGAELAGTGICSGEGGMLPEEQQENSRYFYEYATGRFGYNEALLKQVQSFHFKAGQAAKTGTGGHLPGNKNTARIAEVRGIPEGEPAISPPTFDDLSSADDFRHFADRVREISGGIPVGFKLSANHVERDILFALKAGADYLILDGRGGGTGSAPAIFRDHISVPTIPALARARRCLDREGASGRVTLFITGGLRMPMDFVKALALGADGIALANSAIQAIGCVGARICNTNNCPSGVATQDPELRKRIDTEQAPRRLQRFLLSSVELMKVMARACGHDHLAGFNVEDLATWNREMALLSGVSYAGVTAPE